MTDNTSDRNLDIPLASPNVTPPSYSQHPRKKRSKLTHNGTGSSSSSRPKPIKKQDSDAPETARPCTECGKQFGSWKALFGHMRCHPERQWRGIKPPPNYERGTNATPAPSSSSPNLDPDSSEIERDVVSCLLMLNNGDFSRNSSGVEGQFVANGGVSTSSSGVEGRFECGGCKKVFGSHQALGGHRATHKQVKGCFANTNVIEDRPPPPQEIVGQDKSKIVKLVSGMNHRCNVCRRVFSSGQALGSHMRSHCEKDKEENQVGAIDLNVPPATSSGTSLDCSLDLKLGL